MEQRLKSISLYECIVALLKVLLLLIAGLAFVALFLLPEIMTALGMNYIPQRPPFWSPEKTSLLPTIVPTTLPPGSASPSLSFQEQQLLTEGQNDITIANAVVTYTGVFVGIVTIAVAITVFFGISEVFKIRVLRTGLEADIRETNNKADEVKSELERQLTVVNQHTTSIEDQLRQLDKRTENEIQKFIEASYFFSEGSKKYREGDNQHAIEFYLRALNLQPRNPSILERLGRAYSNLNDSDNAIQYLRRAFEIDPESEPILRSLALHYRYLEKEKAIDYLQSILQKNSSAYEALDFLGLCYRDQLVKDEGLIKDQDLIDKAIEAHEKALAIKKRPETDFYLGILLFYSPKGDKIRAKELLLSAYQGTLEQEHDLRIRSVWKILIHAGVPIVEGNKEEALVLIKDLTPFVTTQRIRDGVKTHLLFLLEGTDHHEWIPEFMGLVQLKET